MELPTTIVGLQKLREKIDKRLEELQQEDGLHPIADSKPDKKNLSRTAPESNRTTNRAECENSFLVGIDPISACRYSRHLLLPSFGVAGQINLQKSSVLVVGAGGLGAPAALYLAAAGIGRLGIADKDSVDLSNLHRQVIHTEASVGQHKATSAAEACRKLNSSIQVVEHLDGITSTNAIDIISEYSVVLDASDNAPTRYLLSDACVLLGKPLVSGAAIGFEGQISVYNFQEGPCYRCLFPQPPPPDSCQKCSDAGVLGVVPGIIGCLQALEAIKIAAKVGEPLSSRMLIFDSLSARFHNVKLRRKMEDCVVCGANTELTKDSLPNFDYRAFTGSPMDDKPVERQQIVPLSSCISAKDFFSMSSRGENPYLLLDVRAAHEFDIASLPGAVNIPLRDLGSKLEHIKLLMKQKLDNGGIEDETVDRNAGPEQVSVYVVCRRGNDSQEAVLFLLKNGFKSVEDITGGLESWSRQVDRNFPLY